LPGGGALAEAAALIRFWHVVEQKRRLPFFETSKNTRPQSGAWQVPRRSPWSAPIIRANASAQMAVNIGTSSAEAG
jgi:hypothetical protein